jgi:hypothetical protein
MLISRNEIIENFFKEYPDDIPEIKQVKKDLLRMDEDDFLELCKKVLIKLERVIKNRYFLK